MRKNKNVNVHERLVLMATTFFFTCSCLMAQAPSKKQPVLGYRSTKILTVGSLTFKDLNRNGVLDKYEDWRLSNEERSKDLLSKMSIEEKIGFMLISTTLLKGDGGGRGLLRKRDHRKAVILMKRIVCLKQICLHVNHFRCL